MIRLLQSALAVGFILIASHAQAEHNGSHVNLTLPVPVTLQSTIIVLSLLIIIGIVSYLSVKAARLWLQHRLDQHARPLQQELSRQDEHLQRARRENLRQRALLDHTVEGVITINQDSIIDSFNQAAVRMFGYQPEEVIGHHISMLMPEKHRAGHYHGIQRFLSTESPTLIGKAVEIEGLHKSGNIIPIELTLSAFKWEGQYYFTGVARDISEQKAEHQALLLAKEDAEKANQAKSEFLSAMSHELRTPLNAILGFAQLLLHDKVRPLSADQQDSLQQILHSGEHLLKLINDVLELSKIETGAMEVTLEPVSLSAVLDECLPLLLNQAADKQISIQTTDIGSILLDADFTKLKQVLLNLMSNAIKYNRIGGEIRLEHELQPHHRLRLNIRDTGIGIAESKQDQLFRAFERLGQEQSNIEGTGVGLLVTKRLIEAMQGSIGFTSSAGGGSCFWIELPLSVTANLSKASHNADHKATRQLLDISSPKQLLYIEDNPANLKLMQAYFNRFDNLTLHCCKSAEAGLDLLEVLQPDLILMDIHLPGMDGLEATRIIQDMPLLKSIPVVAITAAAMKHHRQQAGDLFVAYLTKPVDFEELAREIARHL
ncbi:ATP-binding protein [Methylophaga lonarensis]|uniref:PAS domain-containing hybrid sensor histidine kinase/response regulator n=1 Tax=Methylophaga lonarensis TaxID=999151 RepID=UPI003D2ABF81